MGEFNQPLAGEHILLTPPHPPTPPPPKRLKPLDIAFMKQLDHLVNIVPVIAKADTLTPTEVRNLKTRVCLPACLVFERLPTKLCSCTQILSEIMENGIHIYTGQIDEEEDSDEIKELRVNIYNERGGSNWSYHTF